MKIFGKRPFVLKTAEMGPKIDDIHDVGGPTTPNSESARANKAIGSARGWLDKIAARAEIYKNAQTHAETVRTLLSKKTLSKEDRQQLTQIVRQLGTITPNNASNTIYEDPKIDNFKAAEIPLSFVSGRIAWYDLQEDPEKLKANQPTLLNDSKELVTNCRKAKQQLKDMFEKIYKLTKSFVKDFEKARSKAEKDYSKKSSKGGPSVLDTSKMEALTEQYQKTLIESKVLTRKDSDDQPGTQ